MCHQYIYIVIKFFFILVVLAKVLNEKAYAFYKKLFVRFKQGTVAMINNAKKNHKITTEWKLRKRPLFHEIWLNIFILCYPCFSSASYFSEFSLLIFFILSFLSSPEWFRTFEPPFILWFVLDCQRIWV